MLVPRPKGSQHNSRPRGRITLAVTATTAVGFRSNRSWTLRGRRHQRGGQIHTKDSVPGTAVARGSARASSNVACGGDKCQKLSGRARRAPRRGSGGCDGDLRWRECHPDHRTHSIGDADMPLTSPFARRDGSCDSVSGRPANSRRHGIAIRRAHCADRLTLALSVAIPVFAYIWR
jgi:hypothetical protein